MFIDETGASTKMVRLRGRCRRGERLLAKAPFGHWKTTTFTAGLRRNGLVAPFVLDGPMNGEAFRVYVEKVLVPILQPEEIVVMADGRSPTSTWTLDEPPPVTAGRSSTL